MQVKLLLYDFFNIEVYDLLYSTVHPMNYLEVKILGPLCMKPCFFKSGDVVIDC